MIVLRKEKVSHLEENLSIQESDIKPILEMEDRRANKFRRGVQFHETQKTETQVKKHWHKLYFPSAFNSFKCFRLFTKLSDKGTWKTINGGFQQQQKRNQTSLQNHEFTVNKS